MVRRMKLKSGIYTFLDDEDYQRLRHFTYYGYKRLRASGEVAVYPVRIERIGGKQKTIYLHQDILTVPEGMVCDHKDRNTLHNWRDNLRPATHRESAVNAYRSEDAECKFIGVHAVGDIYTARIRNKKGKRERLGYSKDPVEMAMRYDEKCLEYNGEFALTNKMMGFLE